MARPKPITCPMCSKTAVLDEDKIICDHCDAIYTITKEGGAKVKKTGVFEDHEERLRALENPQPGEPSELEPGPAPEEEEEEPIFEP